MSRSTEATLSGFKVRVIRQSASPIDHTLEEGRSVFVGRSDSCGIQIKGDGVADIHCLIDVENDVVSIQDWASDSGTKVNGNPIDDKTSLQHGDSVVIGTVTFEVLGDPSGGKSKSQAKQSAEVAEEPREESIGMEDMGYDLTENNPTDVAESKPIVRPAAGRLSDSFANTPDDASESHRIDAPIATGDDSDAFDTLQVEAEVNDSDSPLELDADIAAVVELADEEHTFASNHFTEDDLDWDPSTFDDEQVDAEIVQLLKSEIEDLRIQLAERDEQLAAMEGLQVDPDLQSEPSAGGLIDQEFGGTELVGRVDELLAELAEHDERVATLQELLQTAEIQNQAEREERNCLENWVGEIEHRIGERESEWQAEQDALRDRLESANEQRDQLQQQLHAAAKRFGKGSIGEVVPDDTLEKLQKQNSELQAALEESQKQCATLTRQVDRLQNEEPESLQGLRAELAQEKASVSRMRFQLSKQLQEIDDAPVPKDQPDREFAFKLQTLREHLREIHEEEKVEREQKGESLFGRISSLWKRVDDEY